MAPFFERLVTPSVVELKQLQTIYEAAFPPSERKPFDAIALRLHTGDYLCVAARSAGSIAAFALLLPLPNADCTFLEYIAVDKAHQSQGLGSKLLHFIIRDFGSKLVWEVEPPLTSDLSDIRNRRLRFYERLGGQFIELSENYAMPNFDVGYGSVPLRLMQLPLSEQPNQQKVRTLIQGIYAVAYPDWNELRNAILERV